MFEDFYNVFNKKYGGMLEIIIKEKIQDDTIAMLYSLARKLCTFIGIPC